MTTDEPQPATGEPPAKRVIYPSEGEQITSVETGNTYTIGSRIGEGSFGVVYACTDIWNNDLAVKVLKPVGSYYEVQNSAVAELEKLRTLRHPFVTYIFDAFEYRDTFYLVTERCQGAIANLFDMDNLNGPLWLMPIARCVLQAIHYLHINNYSHQDLHAGNIFSAVVRDEMIPSDRDAMLFKVGDLGVAKMLDQLHVQNTRAQWMLPPEVHDPSEFGPIDQRVDIYHAGLLFLELAYSRRLRFETNEILAGEPRRMALELDAPTSFALEKALRRHVAYRTESAMELWRDLNSPGTV